MKLTRGRELNSQSLSTYVHDIEIECMIGGYTKITKIPAAADPVLARIATAGRCTTVIRLSRPP